MQGGEEIWMVKKVHECGYRVAYASRAAVEHTHPSDPESDYRRWFWKGYNFERYLYCGRKRLGWPVMVARYLTKLGRAWRTSCDSGAGRGWRGCRFCSGVRPPRFNTG